MAPTAAELTALRRNCAAITIWANTWLLAAWAAADCAAICEAPPTSWANALGLEVSSAKAFGLAAMALRTPGFCWAKAWKPGSVARARKPGFLTITSKASVCISEATDVSPSPTSDDWTWLDLYRSAGAMVPCVTPPRGG